MIITNREVGESLCLLKRVRHAQSDFYQCVHDKMCLALPVP